VIGRALARSPLARSSARMPKRIDRAYLRQN
jgi:hypothetical protein